LTLGLYDYRDRASQNSWNQALDLTNSVLTVIYLAEAFFKILAKGFVIHKTAYLRETWNIIDFVVVLSGYGFT